MLARIGHVWVVTRENNRASIDAALPSVPERDALHFVYVDLPEHARFWKRGQRGVRLYYVLWQVAALRCARRLAKETPFDVAWHLTLANAWIGSLAPLVTTPFVYGPVGGGVATPWAMMSGAPATAVAYELARSAARAFGRYANPVSRLAFSRAALILAQNEDTRRWLPRRHRHKIAVFPNIVLASESSPSAGPGSRRPDDERVAVFAGRLIHWKGAHLAVAAVARAEDWRLIVCGSGRQADHLRQLARGLGCAERVEFVSWLPRDEFLGLLAHSADALLFPSLHDEAGWTIAEALEQGIPVVCIDRGGPPAIAGDAAIAVAVSTPDETIDRLARALCSDKLPSPERARRRASTFSPGTRTRMLHDLLAEHGVVRDD
jgi:glycosyltransferase involved in cell wall biosynthesis